VNRAQPPDERPVVREVVHPRAFPFTIQAHCEETGELLWEHICRGPEQIEVPGFAPRQVSVTIIDADGERSTIHSNGVDV
jgi:hypothetical protein